MNYNYKRCPRCGKKFRQSHEGSRHVYCSVCETERTRESRQRHPKRWILTRVKARAKFNGIKCSITEKDIPDFPIYCPILPWIKLEYKIGNGRKENFHGRNHPGTISLDRIDSTKGYVPGNVQIISLRANTLKNNATLEELIALGNYATSKKVLDNKFKLMHD